MSSRLLVLVLFFVSGATGLVYQVVWTRQLSLLIGVTVFAAATVLSAFMAGLALGSYWIGRSIDRSPNPVRVYALLEGGIGLAALAVPWALSLLEPVYVALSRLLEGQFLLFNLVRALLVACVLLVPTTLMGGTVPAIGRFLVDRRERIGWNVGLLYAVNTFGAVLGCLIAGFWLVPSLRLSWVIWVTAAVNIAIAAVLLLGRVGETGPAPRAPAEEVPEAAPGAAARVAVAVFAISGFVALGYEILWSRALVAHVHNSTYAFTLMLAVFLSGLAIGNSLLMRFYDRIRDPLLGLGVVQVLTGLSVTVAGVAYGNMIGLTERVFGSGGVEDWQSALLTMAFRAGLVLLPSALLLGMVFPLVARTVCPSLAHLGRQLGGAYAANTAGAISGSLVTAFLLVPVLGVRGSLVLLAGINLALGAACFLVSARPLAVRGALVAGAALLLLVPTVGLPQQLFFNALQRGVWRLIYYHEGITDTTGVWESEDGSERYIVYGDLRGTSGTGTNEISRREAHLAHLLHPNPRRSLHIGFGVGNTLAAAALYPEVDDLDCIELSPHVRETAPFFWTNDNVIDHPKLNLVVDDGRNFLLRNTEPYDVIIADPPELFTASVVNLYTVEFYESVRESLTEDGIFVNWIPTYALGTEEIRMLVAAALEVFPHATVWRHGMLKSAIGGPRQMIVLAPKRPLQIDVEKMRERMRDPALRDDLSSMEIPGVVPLLSLYLAGPDRLRSWVDGVEPVSDDWTRVDFSTPREVYSGYGFGLDRLMDGSDSVMAMKGKTRTGFLEHQHALGTLLVELQDPLEGILVPGLEATRVAASVGAVQAGYARTFRSWERKAFAARRRRAAPERISD